MKNEMYRYVITQSCLLLLWAYTLNLVGAEEPGDIRLVGGTSRCSGTLEMKHQRKWLAVVVVQEEINWMTSAVVCRQLGCGSVVSTKQHGSTYRQGWKLTHCAGSESSLGECGDWSSSAYSAPLDVICSESLRLVNGTSLCSGRVEVKSNKTWVPVYEGDFDQQDAEVVCRELGCGAPSVLQGALYGDVNTLTWTKEFQCKGNESALLDCVTSESTRNTCSPDKTVGLTCSEPDNVRLVGGTSKCTGRLEMKHQEEWRAVVGWSDSNMNSAAVVCRQLGCGSAVSTEHSSEPAHKTVWQLGTVSCVGSESTLRECGRKDFYDSLKTTYSLEMICSESVRLVNGTVSCSGRVEVKSNQSWVQVCEGDFDQQDAEVLCRELGCGPPSVLQGALYGGVKAPMWTKEFQCKGNESVLLNCGMSDSTRNTCSPDKTVGLTCTEPDDVRLVGGTSKCTGRLEMKHQGEWRPVVVPSDWNQDSSSAVCRQLDCGFALLTEHGIGSARQPVWNIRSSCFRSNAALKECVKTAGVLILSTGKLEVICSESVKLVNGSSSSQESDDVRLVGGTSHCTGRLEIQQHGEWRPVSDWSASNVMASAVVCRQLDCGAPVSSQRNNGFPLPVWYIRSACKGSESSLRECVTLRTDTSYWTMEVTCLESVRLVNGTSSCSGRVEVKSNQSWVSVCEGDFDQQDAKVVCRELGCGAPSVLQGALYGEVKTPFWSKEFQCEGNESALLYCKTSDSTGKTCSTDKTVGLTCSDPVRLVKGSCTRTSTSYCTGILEMKRQGQWRRVDSQSELNLKSAAVVCRQLGCGTNVSTKSYPHRLFEPMWIIKSSCVGSESSLVECGIIQPGPIEPGHDYLELICSESDDVRLVGGTSHCTGTLEMEHQGEWRPVDGSSHMIPRQRLSSAVCTLLDCGSVVSTEGYHGNPLQPVWSISFSCVFRGFAPEVSSPRECEPKHSKMSSATVNVICSGGVVDEEPTVGPTEGGF